MAVLSSHSLITVKSFGYERVINNDSFLYPDEQAKKLIKNDASEAIKKQ